MVHRHQSLLLILSSLLVCHANDLDLVRSHGVVVVQLEINIFDEEGPDIVAEAVGVERTLWRWDVSDHRRDVMHDSCLDSTTSTLQNQNFVL